MSISISTFSILEQLTLLTCTVVNVACAFYLFRHYLKNREKITWLFITFFAVVAVFMFFNFLVNIDILFFNSSLLSRYTYLVGATIVAVIGLVMLGIKQLYALPPLVTILAYIQQTNVGSNYTQTYNLIQLLSYDLTGQFIGEPWFITLKAIFPNFAIQGQQIATILNLLYDPLALLQTEVLGIYLALIIVPTTVLFYILAWKNSSGRSLGFSLALTVYILEGFVNLAAGPRNLINILTLIAEMFLALGIFGVLDKLMKREESPKQQVKKEMKREESPKRQVKK